MHKSGTGPAIARTLTALGALGLSLVMPQTPALAGADVSNFNVRNCTSEHIFVCSYDKTDGSLKIPYKARGVAPNKRQEYGCASIGRCKVLVGVSNKNRGNHMINQVVENDPVTLAVAGFAGYTAGTVLIAASVSAGTAPLTVAAGTGVGLVVMAVAVGGAVGLMEIVDGWSDGEVCNQVRRAAQKAGMKPKQFMENGKKYKVIEQYAVDENGNPYVYADGTAVLTYKATQGDSCPAALETKLVAQ